MHEIEAKFQLSDLATAEELSGLAAVGSLRVTGRRAFDQQDVYYDTPARELAGASALLRLREGEGKQLFTLKTGALGLGISRRTEIEEPSAGREIRDWAASHQQAGALAAGLATGALAPMLTIFNRRTLLLLENGPASQPTRIEMVVDRVRYAGPRGDCEEMELELELKSGPEESLQQACEWLRSRYPLEPATQSKYQRALAAVG
jgi:inorganic triphosphatase YgiF